VQSEKRGNGLLLIVDNVNHIRSLSENRHFEVYAIYSKSRHLHKISTVICLISESTLTYERYFLSITKSWEGKRRLREGIFGQPPRPLVGVYTIKSRQIYGQA